MLSAAFVPVIQRQYPDFPFILSGANYAETFSREGITPANAWTLWTAANNGGGTAAIDTANARLLLTTSAGGAGEDVDIRTSGLWLRLNYTLNFKPTISNTSQDINGWELFMEFAPLETTANEFFVGVASAAAGQLSALPTTGRHMGVYVDKSVSANLFLTSANGTTQVTTDTSTAQAVARYFLKIRWTAADIATITLYSAALAVLGTQSVASFTNGNAGLATSEIHYFIQTEGAAAKNLTTFGFNLRYL